MKCSYFKTVMEENSPLTLELEAQLIAAGQGQMQELLRTFNQSRRPDQRAAIALVLAGRRLVILEEDRLYLQDGINRENLDLQLLFWRRDYERRHKAPLAAQVVLEAACEDAELQEFLQELTGNDI